MVALMHRLAEKGTRGSDRRLAEARDRTAAIDNIFCRPPKRGLSPRHPCASMPALQRSASRAGTSHVIKWSDGHLLKHEE
jgi:hypothetical protein